MVQNKIKKHHVIVAAIVALILAIAAVIGMSNKTADHPTNYSKPKTSQTEPQKPATPVTSSTTAKCHINGVLPDPKCTPGSIDPAVTQANIQQTICVKGYTGTVRPALSLTSKLKRQGIIDYGYSDTNFKSYEEDHLVSLELGGAPADPQNLWPEPGATPNPKDKIENTLHADVCAGKISLAEAQHRIATDWTTALNGIQ